MSPGNLGLVQCLKFLVHDGKELAVVFGVQAQGVPTGKGYDKGRFGTGFEPAQYKSQFWTPQSHLVMNIVQRTWLQKE